MATEKYSFTFGSGQQHPGQYVVIVGEWNDARDEMFKRFGRDWSMQYDCDERFKSLVRRWEWTQVGEDITLTQN